MRNLILIAVFLLCIQPSAAQSPTPAAYELVSPAVDDYLQAVPEIMNHQAAVQIPSYWIHGIIDVEFSKRYPDLFSASFEPLLNAYYALDISPYAFFYQRPRWNQWLLLNWIEENHVDLDVVKDFLFEHYTVHITPRDFNADGEHEWLLDIDSPGYSQLVVLRHDGRNYRVVASPLPYYGGGFGYTFINNGFMEEQLFDDLNADGLPEWVLASGGYGANNMSAGHLYVLRWQNGELVNVASRSSYPDGMGYDAPAGGGSPLFPYGVSLHFADDDGDDKHEIIIQQNQSDNWGCTWTLWRIFAWNGREYTLARTDRMDNPVQGCEIRAAEEAMWAGDYQTAIGHYERAFTLPVDENVPFVDEVELKRYEMARLALAYTFAGRYEEASTIIHSITPRPEDPTPLVNFITAVEAHLGDPSAMCQAAHDAFTFECPSGTDACLGSPLHTIVGYTLENFGDGPSHPRNSFPAAAQAGCDLVMPLQDQLHVSPLNTNTSPTDQLQEMGYELVSISTFDLDNDNVDEWLIKLNLDIPLLFLHAAPDETAYHIQFVDDLTLDPHFIRPIPKSNKNLLISIEYTWMSCPPIRPEASGMTAQASQFLVLWDLEHNTLRQRQKVLFCGDENLHSFIGAEGQPLPLKMSAWTLMDYYTRYPARAYYYWDTESATYVLTNLQPTLPPPIDYAQQPTEAIQDGVEAIQTGQFQRALHILERGLTSTISDNDTHLALMYLRGLTLELLNQSSEALAQYSQIVAIAPDSAWAMLSALHLT